MDKSPRIGSRHQGNLGEIYFNRPIPKGSRHADIALLIWEKHLLHRYFA